MLAYVDRKRFEAELQASVWFKLINKAFEPKGASLKDLENLGIKVDRR